MLNSLRTSVAFSVPGSQGRGTALPTLGWLGLALALLGVGCRVLRYLLNFPIWFPDEIALAVNLVERDYRGLLHELSYNQVSPLLFLWIEKTVVQWAGPSEFALRLLPFLAGTGGLILVWMLARSCLSPAAAAMATGILAVSRLPIELACTIKPYALDLFVAALLLSLAVQYLRRPDRVGFLVALALVSPLGIGLSYPSIFVATAVSLVLASIVWHTRKGAARGWFLAFNVLFAGSFLAHLLLVGRKDPAANSTDLMAYMHDFWRYGFPPAGVLAPVGWLLRVHVSSMFSHPVAVNGGGLLGIALLVCGASSLYRHGQGRLVMLCLLPYGLHLIAAFCHRYPYGQNGRLEQHLLPSYCLLVGAGLEAVVVRLTAAPGVRVRWVMGAGAGFAVLGIVIAVSYLRAPYKDELALAGQTFAKQIRDELRPDDRMVIVSSAPLGYTSLRWYLLPVRQQILAPGPGAGLPLPQGARLWVIALTEGFKESGEVPGVLPASALSTTADCGSWKVDAHRRCETAADYWVGGRRYRYFWDVFLCTPGHDDAADATESTRLPLPSH